MKLSGWEWSWRICGSLRVEVRISKLALNDGPRKALQFATPVDGFSRCVALINLDRSPKRTSWLNRKVSANRGRADMALELADFCF